MAPMIDEHETGAVTSNDKPTPSASTASASARSARKPATPAAKIVAFDPYLPAGAWSDIPHTRVPAYRDLLADADVLTLHVPLTDEARGMIGYAELCTMKRTAIVDEEDLRRALEGRTWGAGLDAHDQEPPTADRYGALWKLPNVVSMPNIGAATDDAQLMSALGAVNNTYNYLKSLEQ
ncbi:uncharacterized protein PG986_013355 [Apiospora aurea]|uniref:D-isomer specific 2-hydroxyacid dehydrogenase NAD-binding domain-containing protein n=1 Tax=Apiospora aurea TaxID=335848 RepID=A0ABR1PVB8_9PEZI